MLQRKPNRLRDFDYTRPGDYFVTTVVKGRQDVFGAVENDAMQISAYGKVLVDQWNWLREHYPNIALDEFVVMPNHFHAIVRIVGTGHELHSTELTRPKTKSLSELIGAFKTTTSKQIHRLGMEAFQWQRSFYDRVIRNENELNRIREFIQTNPLRWQLDIENQRRVVVKTIAVGSRSEITFRTITTAFLNRSDRSPTCLQRAGF